MVRFWGYHPLFFTDIKTWSKKDFTFSCIIIGEYCQWSLHLALATWADLTLATCAAYNISVVIETTVPNGSIVACIQVVSYCQIAEPHGVASCHEVKCAFCPLLPWPWSTRMCKRYTMTGLDLVRPVFGVHVLSLGIQLFWPDIGQSRFVFGKWWELHV